MPPVPGDILRSHRISQRKEDLSQGINKIMSEINTMCRQLVFDIYGKKIINLGGGSVARYKNGQSLPVHQDWSITDWVKKYNLPVVHLSSVFYINDNYEGGQLCFSSKKMDAHSHDIMLMKPQAGTIIFFDALQWHAAAPVIDGEKYAVTNF
jgi:predicted 2-oxoglutarate/Fe(II)-dependent dioxygenase YbiX